MQNSKNVGKQGRDDSIKQFSIQPPNIQLYVYYVKRYRGGGSSMRLGGLKDLYTAEGST